MKGRPLHPSLARLTPQIAFSSKGKVPKRNKTNSSKKPNKFHCEYVCFGGLKTREERKICLKIRLFTFSQRLVMRSTTTATRKVVSSSNLIGPFKIWARAQIQRPLALALKFKWTNQSWGWNHLERGHCRDLITSISWKPKRRILRWIFRSSRVFRPPKHTYLKWNLLGLMELLVLLRFKTFPFEEKVICGVWSAFPFF